MKYIITLFSFSLLLFSCENSADSENKEVIHETNDSIIKQDQKELEEEMNAIHDIIRVL